MDNGVVKKVDELGRIVIPKDIRKTGSGWWLRSPGLHSFYAAFVNYDGSVYDFGSYVYDDVYVTMDTSNLRTQ